MSVIHTCLFGLVYMCLHVCLCVPRYVSLCGLVSVDVWVCCMTNTHVCCARERCISLGLCVSMCSGFCHCGVMCLPVSVQFVCMCVSACYMQMSMCGVCVSLCVFV